MRQSYLIAFVCMLATQLAVTASSAAEPVTPLRLFYSPEFPLVLGFDLRDEAKPVAAISFNNEIGGGPSALNLMLPFKTRGITQNVEIFARTGSFDRFSLVTYNQVTGQRWPQQIAFFPDFDATPDALAQNADLRGSLYFYNMGQIWRFLYRYPTSQQQALVPPSQIASREFDSVGIAIPSNARRLEVRGRTAIPEHIAETRDVRFYPSKPTQFSEEFLEIRFEVPPTNTQSLILEYGAKLLAGAIPLLSLLLLGKDNIQRPRLRRFLFIGNALLYGGLLVGLIIYAIKAGEISYKLLADMALVLLAGTGALIIFLIKGKLA